MTGRDGREFSIKPSDIDYKSELPKDAKIDQNPLTWPGAVLNAKEQNFDFEYRTFYNEDKLDNLIDNSSLMNNVTEPKDARLGYKDGEFLIENEVNGNKIDKQKLKEAVIESINTKNNEITLDDSFYYAPKITKDSEVLNKVVDDGKAIADMKIGFNFTGYDFKLEGNELLSLFDVTDHGFELNYDKVNEYVKNLAAQTDTYGKNRKFNATDIGQIVVGPGTYGFRLDVDGTIDKIYELVNSRQSGDIEPVYANRAFVRTSDGGDIGDTYVEVDLSRQKMWFYKDGDLVIESDMVSGLPEEKWASNVGVGQILNKAQDSVLRGSNFDGLTEYETPVDYWMPIGWDGEGFHDAPWRSAFGGDIYLENGSHGCFNLPPDVAKTLFENVDYITPVVVYESSTNFSPPMVY